MSKRSTAPFFETGAHKTLPVAWYYAGTAIFGFLLCLTGTLFYLRNKISIEELSFELRETPVILIKKQGDSLPQRDSLPYFELGINYDMSGDFYHSDNGFVLIDKNTGRRKKNYLEIWAQTSVPHLNTYEMPHAKLWMVSDRFAPVNINDTLIPELVLSPRSITGSMRINTIYDKRYNGIQRIGKVKGKNYYQSCISPNSMTDVYLYRQKDTILSEIDMKLYWEFWSRPRYKNVNDELAKNIDNDFSMNYINSLFKYSCRRSEGISATQLYVGQKHPLKIRNTNTSCIRIKANGLKLPVAKKQVLSIGYGSPMQYDAISIEPDKRTTTSLIYSSPEKLEKIDNEGLIVIARSISNMNKHETWNFIYATLIGIFVSFLIESLRGLLEYYFVKNSEKNQLL